MRSVRRTNAVRLNNHITYNSSTILIVLPGSQYGWCGTTVDHCDAATCLKAFSGSSSSCKPSTPTTLKTSATKQGTSPATTFPTAVPEIDVCGHAQGGVTCPGAGANGYFYRCCSSAGHWYVQSFPFLFRFKIVCRRCVLLEWHALCIVAAVKCLHHILHLNRHTSPYILPFH